MENCHLGASLLAVLIDLRFTYLSALRLTLMNHTPCTPPPPSSTCLCLSSPPFYSPFGVNGKSHRGEEERGSMRRTPAELITLASLANM